MVMTLKEKCCRGAILGSRVLAVLVVLPALAAILDLIPMASYSLSLPHHEFRVLVWLASALALFAYSVIVLLPLQRVSGKQFVGLSIAGAVPAAMSFFWVQFMYRGMIVDFLRGKLIYHVMAGTLLLLFYSYLPVVVCLRSISQTKTTSPTERMD
jgi:hypothetical protein